MRITKNPPWFLVFESQSPERNLGVFGFMEFQYVYSELFLSLCLIINSMPKELATRPIKVNLVSHIARKRFTGFLVKEGMGVFFICLIAVLVFSVLGPLSMGSKHADSNQELAKESIELVEGNQLMVVVIGLIIGTVMLFVLISLSDKFYVVGIIVENDCFEIISRRNNIKSIVEYTGLLEELILYKDRMKFSPFEPARICYRVYKKTEYLGVLAPEHFVWSDYPTIRINNALKNLKAHISK